MAGIGDWWSGTKTSSTKNKFVSAMTPEQEEVMQGISPVLMAALQQLQEQGPLAEKLYGTLADQTLRQLRGGRIAGRPIGRLRLQQAQTRQQLLGDYEDYLKNIDEIAAQKGLGSDWSETMKRKARGDFVSKLGSLKSSQWMDRANLGEQLRAGVKGQAQSLAGYQSPNMGTAMSYWSTQRPGTWNTYTSQTDPNSGGMGKLLNAGMSAGIGALTSMIPSTPSFGSMGAMNPGSAGSLIPSGNPGMGNSGLLASAPIIPF